MIIKAPNSSTSPRQRLTIALIAALSATLDLFAPHVGAQAQT